MKIIILLVVFLSQCVSGEIIRIWKLREVVLDVTNEQVVCATVDKEVFGVVVYLVPKKFKDIEVGDLFASLVKKKNSDKRDGMNPFLGRSDCYAIKSKDGTTLYISIDRKAKGLCRVALLDTKIWPVTTLSETQVTLHSKLAEAIKAAIQNEKGNEQLGNTQP